MNKETQKAARPVVLIICDGWGIGDPNDTKGNSMAIAKTPVMDRLLAERPNSQLAAAGMSVGLPDGQMGNSEVGHLNLGAGRVVYQDFTRISKAITDGVFASTPALMDSVNHVKENNSRLHVIGLCSDGGVHSHLDHLYAILEMAKEKGIKDVFIHALMDGRDTSPTSGVDYLTQISEQASKIGVGAVATIVGRYYAMDRDNRWERVAKAYALFTEGKGESMVDATEAMRQWYSQEKTDEFIPPTIITGGAMEGKNPVFMDGDALIFFNFRADRAREITHALTDEEFDGFPRGPKIQLHYTCMTQYEETLALPIAFPPMQLNNILANVLEANNLTQLRIAETEKYAHVTFFFNGGEEAPVKGEERKLIPSPKVRTYDLQPEMSANILADEMVERVESGKYDVIILNFANADMVGHTGIIPAAVKAVETVDTCLGKVLAAIETAGGAALVTADHGNADKMLDEKGGPFTAHSTNPVPFILVGEGSEDWGLQDGILADVAPTMLQLLGLPVPEEMTGKSLLVEK
jgi:2,3-bisphosphoglycerate-independent phosphoglycerate mutase